MLSLIGRLQRKTIMRKPWFTSIFIFMVITVIAWPALTGAGLLISYLHGEGSVVNYWYMEPKRKLLVDYLSGYSASAIWAAALAAIIALAHLLLAGYRFAPTLIGLALPLAGTGIGLLLYRDWSSALPAYVFAGFLLMLIYLCISAISRRMYRRRRATV